MFWLTTEWNRPAVHPVLIAGQKYEVVPDPRIQLNDTAGETIGGAIWLSSTRATSMSDNTINAALRRMGYTSEEQTGHGFRSMASTLLNEQGFPPDVIELQLAHTERNKVRAAYNKAQRLPERRKMMQAWADYLDGLRAGGNVVPLKHRRAS